MPELNGAPRNEGLIRIAKERATITDEGDTVLDSLGPAIEEWTGQGVFASKLADVLRNSKCSNRPGN